MLCDCLATSGKIIAAAGVGVDFGNKNHAVTNPLETLGGALKFKNMLAAATLLTSVSVTGVTLITSGAASAHDKDVSRECVQATGETKVTISLTNYPGDATATFGGAGISFGTTVHLITAPTVLDVYSPDDPTGSNGWTFTQTVKPKDGCKPESKKVWICHVPPGNPANAHAIEVDENGWNGHDNDDGDFLIDGPNDPDCPPPPPDQCPDGSNPGDANGDGSVNEADCNYTPPVDCPDGTQVPAGQDCPPVNCPDGTTVPNGDECPPVQCPDGSTVPNGEDCPTPPAWSDDCVNDEWVVTGPVIIDGPEDQVSLQEGESHTMIGDFADIYWPTLAPEDRLGRIDRPEGCNPEPTDQCPDGSNPGDVNDDGSIDEEDCNYTPPTDPTTPPTEPTTPPTQPTTPPTEPTTPPTQPTTPPTTDIGTPPTPAPTVPPAPSTPDGGLPQTGESSDNTLGVAAILVVLGAAFLAFTRRRSGAGIS